MMFELVPAFPIFLYVKITIRCPERKGKSVVVTFMVRLSLYKCLFDTSLKCMQPNSVHSPFLGNRRVKPSA